METLFLKLFNMSVTASWIVLAVVILRLLLKKAPKVVTVFLWGLVGIRLVCPFSFESVLSVIPSAEPIPQAVLTGPDFNIDTGLSAVDSRVNGYLDDRYFEGVTVPAGNGMTVTGVISVIWLVGIAVMLIYTLISYLKIHRKVREAVPVNDNILVCDRIAAPFILGVFRPHIYLPSSVGEQDAEYVIAHEKAHLKRRDHLIKPLGFLLLTVYWFNPVMWIAYILLCRDIELACDEKVIKAKGNEIKKPYSEALINCSLPRRVIAACPLAFGEVGVKSRIKSVLNYKKPAIWVIASALALCVILPVVFLTNPKAPGLCDIEFHDSLLDNVTEIRLNKSGTETDIKQKSDVADIVSLLKKVKIHHDPYSKDRSEDRDRTNEIVIHDRTFLCFSKNYELVWIDDGVKPSLSHRIKNPDKVEEIFNRFPNNYGISCSVISAECDNIEYEYLSGTISNEYPHISVMWKNGTDDILCYGEEFTLYKDGKICEPKENTGFNALLHTVDSGATEVEVYNLSAYNLESGKYRLEKQFYLKSNPDKKYRAFISFTVDKTYSFLGKQYVGEKIVYENGSYSYVRLDSEIPQFLISDEDFSLLTTDYPETTFSSSWYKIGVGMQKIKLKDKNFDDLFEPAVWKHGYSAKSLRKNNLNAFSAFDISGRMYYLLEQKNGEIFIAEGNTESNTFRWVYKMRQATEVSDNSTDNETDSSNSQIGGYNPYFNATVLAVSKNSVLVEPFEGSDERKSADKITVNTNVISTHPVPELKKGMQIRVVYNGTIEETYPANIPTAFAIYELREVDGKLEPVIATPLESET